MNDKALDIFDEGVEKLLDEAEIAKNRHLVKRLLTNSLRLGVEDPGTLNMKIASSALTEMRDAFNLFKPFVATNKVTVFGSARTALDDPLWNLASEVAGALAREGWIVVTGAGPGIMEAASSGAGPDMALGVSIRLPFEETPNNHVAGDDRLVSMKYFFTRKLMLVKESSGFICLPGGFGTMDEVYELLTLQQTGKMVPMPIVLLDKPGGTYWQGFKEFTERELQGGGYIAEGDMDRVLVTDSVDKAIEEVLGFWQNYHSLRWVGKRLVLRLDKAPSEEQLSELNREFAGLLAEGKIALTEPLEPEIKEGDALNKERITLILDGRQVGELHRLIRALNRLV